MRFLHILIVLILLFFAHEFVLAESGRGAAIKDGAVQAAAGLGGMYAGNELAKIHCGKDPTPMCQIGIMMGVQSLGTLIAAPRNTNPTRDALSTNNYGGGICDQDPSLCSNNNNNLDTTPDPFDEPIVSEFTNLALQNGVDVNDPESVQKFMDKNAALLDSFGSDGGGAGSLKMPASVQAKIDKYNKYIQSKYRVSSVALEGGGGGRFPASAKSGKGDFDFGSFMDSLNQKDKPKESGIEGLQRKLASGEPVGVAGDNIFKQISRRYQAKRQSNLFLK